MNQELNKLTIYADYTISYNCVATVRRSLLSLHLFFLSTAHTKQIIYVEGLGGSRNNNLHGDGKCSEVNYNGFIQRTKF